MKIRGQTVVPPVERIMRYVSQNEASGCWEWTGALKAADKPYGRLIVGSRTDGTRRSIGAHQYSYLVFKGEIPPGMCVCHTCDNPRCVNPEHLFLGTKRDNARDMIEKGRDFPLPRYRGQDAPWAKLTWAQVEAIRLSKESSASLAAVYGVGSGHIRAIRRGERFALPAAPGE